MRSHLILNAYENTVTKPMGKRDQFVMSKPRFTPLRSLNPRAKAIAAIAVAVTLTAPFPLAFAKQSLPEDEVKELYIVDCLLPGQLRKLGKTTYMTPRRPIRTTAAECNVRGGEYTAYDRADYKTALRIWIPAAEKGDADAQNTVGEIFEQGIGTEPNYEVAAMWYQRAADQGHKTALFNLGTLYEMGKGVPKDKVKAMNCYRKAWGMADDELTYRSEAEAELMAQAEKNAELEQQAAAAMSEAEAAKAEANRAKELAEAAKAEAAEQKAAAEKATADAAMQKEVADKAKSEAEAAAKAAADAAAAKAAEVPATIKRTAATEITADGKNYGRFFALMIGNADYMKLDDLSTPISDTTRLGAVLSNQYGFEVRTVTNGDNVAVLKALNELNEELEENDNLFIYYSGHGDSRPRGAMDVGYWLPVNADAPPNDTYWVPTEQIAGHLARLKAKRVIVVSDSSFAGMLAENPAFLLVSDPAQLKSKAYMDLRFPNRSRLLLTSGTNQPLPKAGEQNTSVFADAFIESLKRNTGILTAPALFLSIMDALETRQPELFPEFKAIKRAGDEVGDFFFVAR